MEEKYYNQIRQGKNRMDIEEAEKIINDMYRDKWEELEQKHKNDVEEYIVLDTDDLELTNLEIASVRMLRECSILKIELEKQEKENTDLKELCIKVVKRLEILGHKHLAKYVATRIDVKNGS